jgi:hypothetical protein
MLMTLLRIYAGMRKLLPLVALWGLGSAKQSYPGGFVPGSTSQCVDICATASPTPTCFNKTDPECTGKKQVGRQSV